MVDQRAIPVPLMTSYPVYVAFLLPLTVTLFILSSAFFSRLTHLKAFILKGCKALNHQLSLQIKSLWWIKIFVFVRLSLCVQTLQRNTLLSVTSAVSADPMIKDLR